VDRITRHDLKTDQFAEQVGHIVEEVGAHRSQVVRYGVIAVAAIAIVGGSYWFIHSRKEARELELSKVVRIWNTPIGAPGGGEFSYADTAAKDKALAKAANSLMSSYSGSDEAGAAAYLLAIRASDDGKLDVAERYLKQAISEGGTEYGGLAKLSLADVYSAQGKTADAEKILKELIANPAVLASKDQATVALAKLYLKGRPLEARKLLEPLRTQSSSVSRIAMELLAQTYPNATQGR
jgi:predicted negative regulator of RcsB-dependent stress response